MKYDLKSLYYKGFYHVLIVPWMAEKYRHLLDILHKYLFFKEMLAYANSLRVSSHNCFVDFNKSCGEMKWKNSISKLT